MNERALNPWWFALWVAAAGGVGYYAGGNLGATEGALIAVVLAHGALLETLRDKIEEIDALRAMISEAHVGGADTYGRQD
jgi:hypothetical protein